MSYNRFFHSSVDRSIHFVPEDVEEEPQPPPATTGRKRDKRPEQRSGAASWPLETVVQVATRRWCLQETAAELFLSSGHAHLLAFADASERTAFLKALENCHLPSRYASSGRGVVLMKYFSQTLEYICITFKKEPTTFIIFGAYKSRLAK